MIGWHPCPARSECIGSCIRAEPSGDETVLFGEGGTRLAAGRTEKQGKLLGPEYNDVGGCCAITACIDLGTDVSQWGGGNCLTRDESDLYRSIDDQLEDIKTTRRQKG
ncbi:hypothetical protein OG897_35830 [Streptomyces sp. NBC_00237]|uniref:hypothetical protein n=1 Tax=Streptomyces sp. NBC_00237 TaxID=2975687 RepID=UPI0022559DB7|nr:hypothetical protein [Streptomyces sp. NBC_00237]MCX5206763.1 hypothetical protein [Streptomyces sp. NBC_00237]